MDRLRTAACSLILSLGLLAMSGGLHSAYAQEPAPLSAGTSAEFAISGGERRLFSVHLDEKQLLRLIVTQLGVDVVVRVLKPDGSVAADYDSDPRSTGDEIVETTSAEAREYILSVEPRQRNTSGKFALKVAEIRPATPAELSMDETRRMLTEANRLWRASEYAAALPLAERALAMRSEAFGEFDFEVSQAVFTVANIYSDNGGWAKSEELYRRTIAIREKVRGPDDISLSAVLNNFGALYNAEGEYEKAEPLFERSLSIREKWLEPDHLLIASVLVNLGNISRNRGDSAKAAARYTRALAIREKALGPDTAEVALLLNNLGNLYDGQPEKAERYYLRALEIRRRVYGNEHQVVAQSIYNLALLYAKTEKYKQALELTLESIAIFEKKLGPEHPSTSFPYNLLGLIYKSMGELEKSEAAFLHSIAIKEKSEGPHHINLAGALSNLSLLYALRGEPEKAVAAQARANEIYEYNATLNLAAGTEREKLGYLRTLSNSESIVISLHMQSAPELPAAAELALATILQRKGRVLDSLAANLTALRGRFDPADRALLDKLNGVTARLVATVLAGPSQIADFDKELSALERERDELESQVSLRSAGYYEERKPVTLSAVRREIPIGSALVEFSLYRPIPPNVANYADDPARLKGAGEPRYAVYVTRREGPVRWADLGSAARIDELIAALRSAVRNPRRTDYTVPATKLDRLVMRPVRELAGDAGQFLISADGNLNLLSFATLIDERGRFLIEDHSLVYLTSGRDLIRMKRDRAPKSPPLIIADPAFGGMSPTKSATRGSEISRAYSDLYFARLAGTAVEGRSVQSIFPGSLLTGADASEEALKRATAPSILHIATHGFFLYSDENGSLQPAKSGENPLLRSGLAFAGANQRKGGDEDGILTALEASGLNLWGTKLVVLSACDTGAGVATGGEGVYGLRRAFILAGAESIVMSLWPVSDLATRELMSGYYENLRDGLGRAEALRRVQLEMIKRASRRHPFYWASFIPTGDWSGIDGRR